MKFKDFEPGTIVVFIDEHNNRYIAELTGNGYNCDNISLAHTENPLWHKGSGSFGQEGPEREGFSKPTLEEILWFRACQKANTIVPKSKHSQLPIFN